jgi:hypothetical protein
MRSITVTAGGLIASSAVKISASQVVPDSSGIVLDGAATSGYSSTSIATTANNGAATTTVTLNGTAVVGGVAILYNPAPVVLVSAGNDSGKTWTVTGIGPDGRTSVVETLAAANVSRVATKNKFLKVLSIKLSSGSAGNVTAGTNGVATLDKARQVLFTSGGSDVGITFTITGTNWAGDPISEVVTGGVSTATSVLDYLTITSIVSSGATASTLTVGTNTVSGAYWVFLDQWAMTGCGIQITTSGTVNFTVQSTCDDPNDATNPVAPASMTWITTEDANAASKTASVQTNYPYVTPKYVRCLINSGTGTAQMTVTQALSIV